MVFANITGRILLGIIVFLTFVDRATAQTWTFTGSMSTSRGHYVAVLLHTGKVLVAGGANSQGTLSSAELYDPGTGAWSATGSMTTPRFYHAAALLHNGSVLVVGGFDSTSTIAPISSAEVYDPVSGTWALTDAMDFPRWGHTATTLVNGQVLIVGGAVTNRPAVTTATAELYDPNTGLFFPTNPIVGTTSGHTATLLSDGRVLVAGGRGLGPFETGQLSSAQVYNSTTGMWALVGRMIVPREGHTATRLQNGQVLIAGGDTTNEITVTSAELFNPATNTFSLTGSMHQARNEQGVALLLNGQVLVAGGSGNPNIPRLASAELYNPLNGMWTDTSSMHTPRDNYTAILLPNGKVLAAGGVSGNIDPPTLEASAELYEPFFDAPPACELGTANPSSLWPPNHQLVSVAIVGVTDPDNDHVTLTITGITQDEPVNGQGDGDTSPDAVIQSQGSVLLRAERSGTGNGRVYEVHFMADDGLGEHCDGSVKVCVPHDQGKNNTCIDDGQRFDATKP